MMTKNRGRFPRRCISKPFIIIIQSSWKTHFAFNSSINFILDHSYQLVPWHNWTPDNSPIQAQSQTFDTLRFSLVNDVVIISSPLWLLSIKPSLTSLFKWDLMASRKQFSLHKSNCKTTLEHGTSYHTLWTHCNLVRRIGIISSILPSSILHSP